MKVAQRCFAPANVLYEDNVRERFVQAPVVMPVNLPP